MKLKVKVGTIARIGALVVSVVNEFLILFGKGTLPFTENFVYQIISLLGLVVISSINCWYNQDITQVALICGKIFDAFKDKELTEEEVSQIIKDIEENKEQGEEEPSYLIKLANSLLKNIKEKVEKK